MSMTRLLLPGLLLTSQAIGDPGSRERPDISGSVRLVLPKKIYAVQGVQSNVYFDNVVLVINPDNFIFDVTCDVGFQYDDCWTCTPVAEEIGDHPIMIEVRDQSNAVIARSRSVVRVAPADSGGDRQATFLAMGDSHLQRDHYMQHLLDLSKEDTNLNLLLVGSRGRGNGPPSDDLKHEGYNGWTAEAFATLSGPLSRSGVYKRPETGSPFMYTNESGESRLDFKRYCADLNQDQPVDFVIIQVGGNDIWRATDEDIDTYIDNVFSYYDALVDMIQAYSKRIKIGIIMLDPLARAQHGYRNYRGNRKQTRWQYRRNQHRMVERQIETYGDREAENIFLVPVTVNLDCVHGFPVRTYPLNARMPIKEQRVYDGSHMSPEGYAQFGDSIYAWLKVCLTDVESIPVQE